MYFIVIVLMSLVFIVFKVKEVKKIKKTKEWCEVEGQITESIVSTSPSSLVDGYKSSYSVKYEYFVDEKKYIGRRVRVDNLNFNHHDAQKKYPLDSRVTVYYNSEDPKDSILEKENIFQNYIAMILGVASMIFVAYLIMQSE